MWCPGDVTLDWSSVAAHCWLGPNGVEPRRHEHLDGPQGAAALDDDHVQAVGVLG
jgi:hypothetical protein